MAIWIPYKAPAKDRMKRQNRTYTPLPKMCRICGKTINGSGHLCEDCKQFIHQKQKEERRQANDK